MTYSETLDFLYAQLPMFQRIGASAFKKDLSNTHALCAFLDNPHQKFRTIHVGGTNGKGSVSHYIAAILQAAGYNVGLYTSPHLQSFRERIRYNGEMIEEQYVIDFVAKIRPLMTQIKPSFFEMTVAMAFDYFAQKQPDIAIIEVGMGGRLDSTNVIDPLFSVITHISYDHMQFLGTTLPEIAGEKAGIIKKNRPVIIGNHQAEVEAVFERKAEEMQSALYFADKHFSVEETQGKFRIFEQKSLLLETESELRASYQTQNLPTVCQSVSLLREAGFQISKADFAQGIAQVCTLTGLRGRWELLSESPRVITDVGHNEDGVKAVLKQISQEKYRHLHIVWGSVSDKDQAKILCLLPPEAHYYFCAPDVPRALDAQTLAVQAAKFGLKNAVVIPSVKKALEAARKKAQAEDLIFVGGSTFVVAEVL
ncbi:MAG: bifunctional folylpolyglutamate synthase/dihydrofolate synthase [Bernardetiaceae bacterium]|nr:bifunctional folylpolyglutamate synthase/dihydrofolate synthase [Bernardetiaceae bacterium]